MKKLIIAVAFAFACSPAYATGKATVKNKNYNSQGQGQKQGQKQSQGQGQAQGQAQSIKNSGNSTQGQSTDNANNAAQSTEISQRFEAQKRNPVSTAYAPALTSGIDTCMGSSSLGAQGVGFGLALGSTWTDNNCMRLKNSRELSQLGYGTAALALICQDPSVAQAMKDAGDNCPGGNKPAAKAEPQTESHTPFLGK